MTGICDLVKRGAGVIRFSFQQSKATGDMILLVEDNTNKVVDYRAMIVPAGREEAEATTTCDVPAQRFGVEVWPYNIGMIELSRFRFLDPAPPPKCD